MATNFVATAVIVLPRRLCCASHRLRQAPAGRASPLGVLYDAVSMWLTSSADSWRDHITRDSSGAMYLSLSNPTGRLRHKSAVGVDMDASHIRNWFARCRSPAATSWYCAVFFWVRSLSTPQSALTAQITLFSFAQSMCGSIQPS